MQKPLVTLLRHPSTVWPVPYLLAEDIGYEAMLPSQAGRLRPATLYPDILQSWLQMCELNHTSCVGYCSPSLIHIRLYDVIEQCLKDVSLTGEDSTRYVALSYVWGSAPQPTMLTMATRESSYHPKGLDQSLVSETPKDAIEITKMYKVRYLWVDILCTIQDHDGDMQYGLSIMGQIYARDLLTIAAAASQNARSGLPGVSGKPRPQQQVLGPLRGGRLMTLCDSQPTSQSILEGEEDDLCTSHTFLKSSIWNSRGWTF